MKPITISIEPDEHARLRRLAALSGYTSIENLIDRLLDHVDQGITRPGAWERDWLAQIVGPGPLAACDELVSDAEASANR
ncbi:hypothetical protein [Aeoliella sp.]|uniref:hypothetical protein n=1 Tax=Aeoliella sp. TaxID=2795800 RepID=UPI003CCBFF0C